MKKVLQPAYNSFDPLICPAIKASRPSLTRAVFFLIPVNLDAFSKQFKMQSLTIEEKGEKIKLKKGCRVVK